MEVKICGLTQERETQYLSLDNCKADYAGFVFFDKRIDFSDVPFLFSFF